MAGQAADRVEGVVMSKWTTPQLVVLFEEEPVDAKLAFAKGRPGARRCITVLDED
jgi:hypothetical protein